MAFLADTHTIVWWFTDDAQLSPRARSLMDNLDAVIFVSAASTWETSTKFRLGKLASVARFIADLPHVLNESRFRCLSVTVEHGHRAGLLLGDHKDPFDRMIAAQAIVEGYRVITVDSNIAALGAPIVW